MLRSIVIALGVVCIGGGAVAFATGVWPGAIGPMIFGTLLILGTLFERLYYKPVEHGSPGPGWVATEERFVDEDNGKMVRVWLEPKSGERKYVRD
ncbi:MAG TPA: hypothetical protein VFV07_10370 [Rhizomicrobium sp.]|nr:hypothetical protein [Rhizomicrobium sp.]